MKITVEFLSVPTVTRIIGSKSLSVDFSGQTADDLMNQIGDMYGQEVRRFLFDETGKLDRMFKVLLNKEEWLRGDTMNKPLKNGDLVTVMMLIAGG